MKKKHFRHRDFIKVSKEMTEHTEAFNNFLIYFLSQPIRLKDKRRNPELYEVTNLEISNDNDDFVRELFTIVRTFSYKTNK